MQTQSMQGDFLHLFDVYRVLAASDRRLRDLISRNSAKSSQLFEEGGAVNLHIPERNSVPPFCILATYFRPAISVCFCML